MPVVPSCLLEPAWVEFRALLNEHRGGEPPEFAPGHPWGCHRRRVSDRVVFEHVINALVHGSGYERIATPGCSDRTIRRRLALWAGWGLAGELHAAALRAYDQLIGLQLGDVAVDGWKLRGVIDRIDRTDDGWRIIDYKSGRPVARRRRDLQVALYALGAGSALQLSMYGVDQYVSQYELELGLP